ncbi:MAG: hypothetical protein IH983_05235 [Planctomycetes bacterium]|nr:hypothetical protein [Planctomycetota bacterium]
MANSDEVRQALSAPGQIWIGHRTSYRGQAMVLAVGLVCVRFDGGGWAATVALAVFFDRLLIVVMNGGQLGCARI